MVEAIMEAFRLNRELIDMQHELRTSCGLPPYSRPEDRPNPVLDTLRDRYSNDLRQAKQVFREGRAQPGGEGCSKTRVLSEMCPEGAEDAPKPAAVKEAFHALQERVVREMILDGYRPDGRGPKDIRKLYLRGRHAAVRARLGDLPARRDPGPGDHRARHRR